MMPNSIHRRSERGMTTLGMLILVTFIGLFFFAGLRLLPVYLNYFKISGIVNGVVDEFEGQNASSVDIRNSIARRYEIEGIKAISVRDIKVIAASGGYEVSATYEHKAPFIGNMSFLIEFDKRELVRR